MAGLLVAVVILVGIGAFVVHRWANTPYGRLAPQFAALFRISDWLQRITSQPANPWGGPADIAGFPAGEGVWGTPERRRKLRGGFEKQVAMLAKPLEFSGEIEDREIEGPAGPIPIRIYRPTGPGPFPAVVYYHGGGWIVGSIGFTEQVTRSLSMKARSVVVSVDYRMAPEASSSILLADCYTALQWTRDHSDELNVSPDRIAVAGDSAGGNISAVMALKSRDAGDGLVAFQALIYPAVDITGLDTGSYRDFASGYGLSRDMVNSAVSLYTPDATERTDPHVSPIHAADLAGVAPALVVTAGFDVLRDEGRAYAEKLCKAGVATEQIHYPDMPHGFLTMSRVTGKAEQVIDEMARAIRARLG